MLIAQVGEKLPVIQIPIHWPGYIPAYQLDSFYFYIRNCTFAEVITYSSVFIIYSPTLATTIIWASFNGTRDGQRTPVSLPVPLFLTVTLFYGCIVKLNRSLQPAFFTEPSAYTNAYRPTLSIPVLFNVTLFSWPRDMHHSLPTSRL
jgi:hypothetical protein